MKQVYFFYILFLLIVGGCKKETPVDTDIPASTNPTSYLLKKISYYHSSGELGLEFLFEYNSANLVKEAKQVQWWQTAINTPPVEWKSDTITYHFEYRGHLPVKCITQRNGYNHYTVYTYKGSFITHKVSGYSATPNEAYTRYVYDVAGNLVEAVDSTDRANFRHVFTYNNNLTTQTTYTIWSTPQRKRKLELGSFDNKVNYTKAINGLPPMFTWETLNIASSTTANNYTTSNHYGTVDIDKEYEAPRTISFTYEYNEEGLPTKMFAEGSVTVFEYQKYK